ncbi:chlorophyll a-b binding protein CP24 10A [Hibiscus syriacus]|uniref:Chlorophyll a-b binding protein CP24 10A n=2 Tax=Hibiscus syriacus TaxID=106335 RepID=A0A6A3AF64_HIBSY|nr:chlorophyll a-b binding protein CP24 10A [Hibiscus syriacus]
MFSLPFPFLLFLYINPPSSRFKRLAGRSIPEGSESYTLWDNKTLKVFLDRPCLTRYENMVFFDGVESANLTYGSLIGVVGLTQEELFLWLPVKDIIANDPKSGLILFDIGVAHKHLPLSLFEEPPSCKPN